LRFQQAGLEPKIEILRRDRLFDRDPHVRSPEIIRRSTKTRLVKPGCFNFDHIIRRERAVGVAEEAGFANVKCFWDGGRRALVGGFRK
jgi:hypothetical protein